MEMVQRAPAGNAQAQQAFWNNPAIQSQLDIGRENTLRGASAAGTLTSGGTLADLDKFSQQVASQGWQNYVGNLQPYFGAQAGAAQGIGRLASGLGHSFGNTIGPARDERPGAVQ